MRNLGGAHAPGTPLVPTPMHVFSQTENAFSVDSGQYIMMFCCFATILYDSVHYVRWCVTRQLTNAKR